MVVYGDLLFLINFSMDFLCFYLSCLLLHRRLPTARACIASVLGGIYSVVSLFISAEQPIALLCDVGVLLGMCAIVYISRGITVRWLIKASFLYFFVSALLGGMMTALFSLFNRMEIFAFEEGMDESINVWIFALLAIAGSVFTLGGGKIFRSSSTKRTAILKIRANRDKMVTIKTLIDSGNLACEPISGRGVVFASLESCRGVLDDEIYENILKGINLEDMPLSVASRIRLIPSITVGGSVFLPAIRFTDIELSLGKTKKELDLYVALVRDGVAGDYDAIISNEAII